MSEQEQKAKIDFSKASEPPRTINRDDPEAPPLQPDTLKDDAEVQDASSQVVKANISSS
jgi:hypothetical protein